MCLLYHVMVNMVSFKYITSNVVRTYKWAVSPRPRQLERFTKNIYCDITVKNLFAFLIVVSVFIPLKLNIPNFFMLSGILSKLAYNNILWSTCFKFKWDGSISKWNTIGNFKHKPVNLKYKVFPTKNTDKILLEKTIYVVFLNT